MGRLLLLYSEDEPSPLLSPLLTVPNVTAHPSTASVPITVLLYDGPLLCSFHQAIKGLTVKGRTCDTCQRPPIRHLLSVRCPFRDHISKNKQDRPIITIEH